MMTGLEFLPRRVNRLTLAGQSKGVSCDADGPSLGPVRLLTRKMFGFEPRPTAELDFVLSQAFRAPFTMEKRMQELNAVARALNDGDLARAMIATLHMCLPALDEEQAFRARRADKLIKGGFNSGEPRDALGRWTIGGGGTDIIPAQYVPGRNEEGENGDQRLSNFQGNPNVQIDPSLAVREVPVGEAMPSGIHGEASQSTCPTIGFLAQAQI